LRPQAHVAVSAGLGAIFWAKSRDWRTFLISVAFGVLVDLDHLFDYWYSERRLTWNTRTFMSTRYWRRSGRVFLLFHAFEHLPMVFLLWQAFKGRKWAVAATSAMSSHVLADHFVNELRPLGYFLSYRIAHRFRASEIMDWDKARRVEARRHEQKELKRRHQLTWYKRLIAWFI
jgi:hypothetical protein